MVGCAPQKLNIRPMRLGVIADLNERLAQEKSGEIRIVELRVLFEKLTELARCFSPAVLRIIALGQRVPFRRGVGKNTRCKSRDQETNHDQTILFAVRVHPVPPSIAAWYASIRIAIRQFTVDGFDGTSPTIPKQAGLDSLR